MPLFSMIFRYIGEAKETTVFGYDFPKGEQVEVTEPYAIAKLQNHPLFEVDDNDNRTVSTESIIQAEGLGQGRNRPGRPAKRK